MKDLTDNERKIIKDNWNEILKNSNQNIPYKFKIDTINISCISWKEDIQIILKDTCESKQSNESNKSNECNKPKQFKKSKRLEISKNARIMKFKINEETNEELIYNPESIDYLTKYYKMQHPVYKKIEDKDSKEILDISVGPSNYRTIFDNYNITEIYDDKFNTYINEEEYYNYYDKLEVKVSDYYDNFSVNSYSKKIKDDEILYSDEREKLSAFIKDIKYLNEKFIFIIGCQNIGLSFTILQHAKNMKMLYLNFNDLFNTKKHSDKKKYIFRRLFNWFNDYKTYESFINNEIYDITGYDNILNVIKLLIDYLCNKSKENDPIKYIVLDNYDDFYVGSLKLSISYIEDLYSKLDKKNIKIIILGNGIFISRLFLNYFFEPKEIQSFIKIKYISSLNLNLENDIHNDNIKNGINEIENYYKKKFINNIEYIIYNLIILKNLPNIINKSYPFEIPFQFFKFKRENNQLEINYQFDDIIDINKKIIRKYIAQLNSLKSFSELQNEKIQGYIFEDLAVSLFINNQTFKNVNFKENKIIEVEDIYNMKNIKQNPKLKSDSVLIIQSKNGEVFDFGFIIEKNGTEYFIGGQIGLNKTIEQISKYICKIQDNEQNILDNINKLTGRNITELRFLIIFNKEWQDELFKEYSELYSNVNNQISKANINISKRKNSRQKKNTKNNKQKTAFEKNIEKSNKDKLNHFNSRYGVQCCKNEDISYIFFSNIDFKFYDNEKKEIEIFDVDDLHPIKKGFGQFIFSEYNLIPINSNELILTKKEIDLLLKKIKEEKNDIINIEIKYKLRDVVRLLNGTPYNRGILSITKDIKVFTYYEKDYIHYLIKKNKITIYPQSGELFDDEYIKKNILCQYFVKLVSEDAIIQLEEDENVDEDNNKIKKTNKTSKKKLKKK